ncbi:beta-Ig-H3/fasciclin [Streptomyces parvus]|uniref:beta-Ig-H3/fasciclin n=1 Tax=Streptomyces parvus TaxID=66428 RepID=UPI0035DACF34
MVKKTGAVSATLLAVSLSAAVTAPSAYAADTAPSCIRRDVINQPSGISVWLKNTCGTTKKVKVVISLGSDSPCWSLKDGATKTWWYDGFGSYDRTVLC